MLSDNANVAQGSNQAHFANFIAKAAYATNICNLNIRGRYSTCFFCSILDQLACAFSKHIVQNQSSSTLVIRKAAKNTTHKYIVQAVFNHNRAFIIQVSYGCCSVIHHDASKADDTAYIHAVTSIGSIDNLVSINSGFHLRGNLDRRSVICDSQAFSLGNTCRTHDAT